MKPKITVVDGCKLRIAAFECDALGKVSQKTIDMTPYAGQRTRIWLDENGTCSLDPRKDHYWQICELDVPDIAYAESKEKDPETGETAVKITALPLDLAGVKVLLYDLPGTAKPGGPEEAALND